MVNVSPFTVTLGGRYTIKLLVLPSQVYYERTSGDLGSVYPHDSFVPVSLSSESGR